MRLLLDTHALVWWWTDDRRLSAAARAAIAAPANVVLVSAASAWEIASRVPARQRGGGRAAARRLRRSPPPFPLRIAADHADAGPAGRSDGLGASGSVRPHAARADTRPGDVARQRRCRVPGLRRAGNLVESEDPVASDPVAPRRSRLPRLTSARRRVSPIFARSGVHFCLHPQPARASSQASRVPSRNAQTHRTLPPRAARPSRNTASSWQLPLLSKRTTPASPATISWAKISPPCSTKPLAAIPASRVRWSPAVSSGSIPMNSPSSMSASSPKAASRSRNSPRPAPSPTSSPATSSSSMWSATKTATAPSSCRARRRGARKPGPTSKRRSRASSASTARSTAGSRAASPSISAARWRSCPAARSISARCATSRR